MSASPSDKLSLDLAAALLAEIDSDLGLALTRVLLEAALRPGLSINELADRLGVPQQTASRHVAMLQGRYEQLNPTIRPGAALVSLEISLEDPRKRALFLTKDGQKRIDIILSFPREET